MGTRMLDIDMDFFINDIAHWTDDYERLDDEYYYPWDEERFRYFLENKCLLSKDNPTSGRIIKHHDGAFHFWKQLINQGRVHVPFEVTHIDAHSDTGLGDANWLYIMEELAHYPMDQRIHVLDHERVNFTNYLAFVMACGWMNKVDFVLHPEWSNDLSWIHLKDYDDNSGAFQIKAYNKSSEIMYRVERLPKIPPISVDPEIPYSLIDGNAFMSTGHYDYVVFCQSPGYTPASADFMLNVIKEYIKEE